MIWHIFKKDWRLLWPGVAAVASINVMERVMLWHATRSADMQLISLGIWFQTIAIFATGIFVVVLVHQDPIPGLRQDWLVRPIKRIDLLLSKLLFAAVCLQGPIFVAEVGQGIGAGLPLAPSIGTALSRSIWMLLAIDLPCLALAALTRKLGEAMGAALIALVGYVFLVSIVGSFAPTRLTVMAWITESAQGIWGLIAIAVVLALQYRRRKTFVARWTFGIAILGWFVLQFVPWRTAFAIEERLSSRPGAANSIHVAFDPVFGKAHRPGDRSVVNRYSGGLQSERDALVFIPLRIDGLSRERMLMADQTGVRVTDPDGRGIELGKLGPSATIGAIRESSMHQTLMIQEDGYNRVKDQRLRLEIDYSLTLLQANPMEVMPAVSGDRWIPDLGHCATKMDAGRTQVELHCVTPGKAPCADWSLEDARVGLRIMPAGGNQCWANYAPFAERIAGLPTGRFDANFLLGSVMDQSQLQLARVVSLVYRPVAHFTRQVVIPDIRLSDWRAE